MVGFFFAGPGGLEPPTPCLEGKGRC